MPPKTFNNLLERVDKYIQYKEKLTTSKEIYGWEFEQVEMSKRGVKETKQGNKKMNDIKKYFRRSQLHPSECFERMHKHIILRRTNWNIQTYLGTSCGD